MKSTNLFCCFVCVFAASLGNNVQADVVSSDDGGFQIVITETIEGDAKEVFLTLTEDFSKWWDPAHSYSGNADNLAINLEKSCLLETLPDGGFVRHMEIVYIQPGKSLRMTGGLGPLQEMGVNGAMTFALSEKEGKTQIKLTYNVSGFTGLQLQKLAEPVNGVLSAQLKRLKKMRESK